MLTALDDSYFITISPQGEVIDILPRAFTDSFTYQGRKWVYEVNGEDIPWGEFWLREKKGESHLFSLSYSFASTDGEFRQEGSRLFRVDENGYFIWLYESNLSPLQVGPPITARPENWLAWLPKLGGYSELEFEY